MIDMKKIKDAFNKDKLPKFDIHKEKAKKQFTIIKHAISKGVIKSFQWTKNVLLKLKDKINKENFLLLLDKCKVFFSKVKNNLAKENLQKTFSNIRNSFTKENIKNRFENFKVNFKENKKAYIAFIALGLIIITSLIISITNNRAVKEAMNKRSIADNQAEEYFYSGKYDKAIEEYNKLKEKNAEEGLWDAKIAEIFSVKGDIDNSNIYIQKAKDLGSKNAQVLNYIVFTEFMNKDYKTALQYGEEALNQFPKDRNLNKTMFSVYMANNLQEKVKTLLSSYPVDVKSAYDIAEYARMLMVAGQWEEGYKELRNAWDIDKDEYKIYDVLAQISVYNKDTLLENVTSLSEKNPNDLAYKMWLAKIYSLSDASADQSNQLLETLKKNDVGKIEIKLIEASVLQNLKKNDEADKLIESVIENNKNDYRVLHTAGWYYLNKMNFATAEKYCRESISKNKNYPDNYGFLMPEILKAQGKTVEGEPYFRTALSKEPYNYNIMLTIANYYWYTTKDTDKAMENFKLAELIKPNEPEIKYNMALINISNKKYDEAVNLLKTSIKLSDSTAKYHRTLGTIYLINKKPKEAIAEIRYAYGSDQEDIMTLNNAGAYYITQDVNLEKGEYNLRKALEGINDSTDKYTADTIRDNYKKAKDLLDKYNGGSGNELKMPEFVLFY